MNDFRCACRVKEDSSGNITMKETGSKPLKREDLDSDVSPTECCCEEQVRTSSKFT